ncbi:MAG: ABC transporter permease [Actinomycetota bacterium]
MSAAGLTLRQVRFTNKSFWRNPASAFFTFAFPLMFLVIFTSLLGGGKILIQGTNLKQNTYYVVAMATFGVISACFTNIAISVCFNRDSGILKRTRGTPLPGWSYLGARVIHATIVGAILVVITLLFGLAFYDGTFPAGMALFEFVATFLVGALAFSALAFALTGVIPNADAAPPIVNAAILPLLFLSGIFIPLGDNAPAWIRFIGTVFPVRHFADAMRSAYLSKIAVTTPAGMIHPFVFHWSDVLVIAAWGVAGLVLAARFFSWEPRK